MATQIGRPHELTPAVSLTIIQAIELGASWQTAAELAGKTRETLRQWRNRGERDLMAGEVTVFSTFFAEVTRARARAKMLYVRGVASAATGAVIEERTVTKADGSVVRTVRRSAPDTRAALQMLRTLEGQGYSPTPQQVELSGPGGGPIPIAAVEAIAQLSVAQMDDLDDELQQIIDGEADDTG